MKIEIGESLGYSYLRHVKGCWLVQTNWKPSPHWPIIEDTELEETFRAMKERFDDAEGNVFKQTRTAAQFIQQAEIDVMGLDREGGVYAIDVAFHEAGLNYLGGPEKRVLKKLLRTMMTLQAYHPTETQLHITFASPKVNPGVQQPLEGMFKDLRDEYPDIVWELLTNDAFTRQMLRPTVEKGRSVNDTAELFMRSVKLLDVADKLPSPPPPNGPDRLPDLPTIQPLVRNLMQTLLEDYPDILEEFEKGNLADEYFCRYQLNLQISNFPLLRPKAEGRSIRYWKKVYGGRYYVCSQWWKAHHRANAEALLEYVNDLIRRNRDHPGTPALESHRQAFQEYLSVP